MPNLVEGPAALGETDVRVIGQMLGAGLERDQERVTASGLARSTFQEGKRRAYALGWLHDRYLPAPEAVGTPFVTFALLRPYVDRLNEVLGRLSDDPGTVLLWESESSVLAVLFHRGPSGPRALGPSEGERSEGTREFFLTVDAREPSVPVYFDLEGAWCRWTGTPGPLRYPRPLPALPPRWRSGGSERVLRHPAISNLLSRPALATSGARQPHLLGPRTLPRSQRKLLFSGLAEWRVFTDLARLPPYHGARLSHVVLLHGTLREGARLIEVFQGVVQGAGARPFLLASDRSKVLLGVLGSRPVGPSEGGADPEGTAATEALLRALGSSVSDIGIVRLPTSGLRSPVFHRYDRLLRGTE